MAVTRLKRKDRRNKSRAANRINRIKQLTRKPVIKKLDADNEAAAAARKTEKLKSEESQVTIKQASTSGEEE